MPRAVLFLAAFLSLANAQAPRSAVYSALDPSSQSVAPLADLIKRLDERARTHALEMLDALDRAPLTTKDLSELSEAYRLLGRSDKALETASMISTRGGGPGDATLQIQALANSGDYGGATAAAQAALKKYPTDPNLLAAYHQVKNRAASAPNWTTPTAGAEGIPTQAGGRGSDVRPYVLPINKRIDAHSSGVENLHISGSDTDAPAATLWDRIAAYVTPSKQLIADDVAMVRKKAATFDISPETTSLATTQPEVPRQFVAWLKTMRPEDLPPIEYGIVSPGDYAEYKPGLGFAKGKIVMSHFIRDAEPEARATALMHEIYHYWDLRVARNSYETETYGMTSPENRGDREYDPYLLTAYFWKHVRPNQISSPMAKDFDEFPTEPDVIKQKVDAVTKRRRE